MQIALTPTESKRLIGRAIAQMDIVQRAYKRGIIVIATSTTTAYVAEELLNKEIANKGLFTAGVITSHGCCVTNSNERYNHHVIVKGEVQQLTTPQLPKILSKMGPNDVFVKGANAIDPYGIAAILLGAADGGTIGTSWGFITSNGIRFIIAVSLEKLVPYSLSELVSKTGRKTVDKSLGMAVGMMTVEGEIITELEAFGMLTGVEAFPIGSGGIDGGEGSKILVLEGDEESLAHAYRLAVSIKGEPPLKTKTMLCEQCDAKCDYKQISSNNVDSRFARKSFSRL